MNEPCLLRQHRRSLPHCIEWFDGDYMNSIAVLMNERRLGLRAAVERVTALADEVNAQFRAAGAAARERCARYRREREVERYLAPWPA